MFRNKSSGSQGQDSQQEQQPKQESKTKKVAKEVVKIAATVVAGNLLGPVGETITRVITGSSDSV